MGFTPAREREGWVLLKIPRGDSDIRWGLKDPESGEVAQARGRPALEEVMMMMFITIIARD